MAPPAASLYERPSSVVPGGGLLHLHCHLGLGTPAPATLTSTHSPTRFPSKLFPWSFLGKMMRALRDDSFYSFTKRVSVVSFFPDISD